MRFRAPGWRAPGTGWPSLPSSSPPGTPGLLPRKVLPKGWPEDVKAFVKGLPDEVVSALAFFLKKDFEAGWLAADGEALRDTLLLLKGALEYLRPRIPGEGLDYLELELGARRALGNAEGSPARASSSFTSTCGTSSWTRRRT